MHNSLVLLLIINRIICAEQIIPHCYGLCHHMRRRRETSRDHLVNRQDEKYTAHHMLYNCDPVVSIRPIIADRSIAFGADRYAGSVIS